MGPYLTVPRKEKDSVDGENAKVIINLNLIMHSYLFYSLNMVQLACKDGETQWKTHILLNSILGEEFPSLEYMMGMEVLSIMLFTFNDRE
jgi:hypothetical protein